MNMVEFFPWLYEKNYLKYENGGRLLRPNENMDIETLISNHHNYFQSGKTLDFAYRKAALDRLKTTIKAHEKDITAALHADLGKSKEEAYLTEIGMALHELDYIRNHFESWAKPKKVRTELFQFPSKGLLVQEPFGTVLVMSPWNYPFLLCIDPLIGAVAAGNCVVLKPSAYSPETSRVIGEIVAEAFDPHHVSCIQGGRNENISLLEQKFDYIFFTGGGVVGRMVMEKAAANLTPISLELGGKSPCIIEKTANLKVAAKRLVFGKYLNCGQTCIAPDYVFVDETIKEEFMQYVIHEIQKMYGKNPLENLSYGKIINKKHFERLLGLIPEDRILYGGKSNAVTLQIEPTIIDQVKSEDAIMQEEIFGPLMPILPFKNLDNVEAFIKKQPKPLACYLFTEDKEVQERFMRTIPFGGGCINDTIMHVASKNLPFGGVGNSGMGSYHGKKTFTTFSHEKSVLKKSTFIDPALRYRPYKKLDLKIIQLFLK